jgi:hypothetical protein
MHMRASLVLALAAAGLSFAGCSQTDPSEERSRQLSAKMKADEEIRAEAEARVAHLPEQRRAGERVMIEQAIRLNRQGHVCAAVVTASPLAGTNDSVVTCQVALFRDETVSYRIAADTGIAIRL